MKIGRFNLSLVILIKILFITYAPQISESVAVMSIDLGSEFIKIGIVKPGIPMEIVLNKETRRKTPLAVSLRKDEREFGEGALSQAIKHPKSAYLFLTQLLAKSLDSPAIKAYREKYPYYDIREDPVTKTIYFQHDENTTYTPEELLAMVLDYARSLAADFGEQAIDGAVITVPPYFNQAERKAVLKAAEIANLKVLQLISSNIAAGLNYGVFRRKDFNSSGTTLMFFDVGSTGTVVTVATYQLVKLKDDYEANPQLTVRGVGYDRTLGGNAFSMRLARHFAKLFQEKTKKDVFTNPKAILKIYKEADRIKNILSANADHVAQIEGLMDDVDFKAKITRDEFEQMSADLFDRIKNPIRDAIKSAEIIPDEISSVILFGAGTRIPKVQDEVLKATKKSELAKNLNTDEAAALGAVYQAAFQSKGYKVKKFYIKDYNLYPLVVDFEKSSLEGESTNSQSNRIRRVLFDRSNPYPQRKVMTFNKHTHDFDFSINYGDLSFLNEESIRNLGSLNLSQVDVKGVQDIFEKHKNEESKGIKVHFRLDDSGILRLDKIDVAFEKMVETTEESTLSKIGNRISSFFGSLTEEEKSKDQENNEREGQDSEEKEAPNPDAASKSLNETQSTNSTADSALNKNATLASNLTVIRENIDFNLVDLDSNLGDKSSLDASRIKLEQIKQREKEKRKRAAAINSLEAFIFDTRDKITHDEFIKCSTKEERDKISNKLDETDSWQSEADNDVPTKEFTDRLSELKSLCKDVFFRINEKKLRPKKLDELRDILNRSSEFLVNTRNLTGEDLPLTQVETTALEKLINSTKEWRIKLLNEQAKVADHEQPKLLSNDISDKIEALKREVSYLLTKIKYFRPKTKKPTSSDNKTNGTDSSDSSSNSKSDSESGSNDSDSGSKNDESSTSTKEEETSSQNDDSGKSKQFEEDIFDQTEKNADETNNQEKSEKDTEDQQSTTTTDEPDPTKNPEL